MTELINLSLKLLGWFVAGLMFVGSIALIFTASVITLDVGIIVYNDLLKRLKGQSDEDI